MFLVCQIILLVHSVGSAKSFVETFANQSRVIPQLLLSQGNVGGIDIAELLKEIQTVTWLESSGIFLAGSGETRTGAIYFVSERKVIVNSARAQFEPRTTMPVAALHEALGALGYADENYEASILLYLNTYSPKERATILPHFSFARMNARLHKLQRRNGDVKYAGGTSVGGGGDGIAVQVKVYAMMMAQALCDLFGYSATNIYDKILDAQVEINPKVTESSVVKEAQNGRKVWRVPMVKWINGNIQTREKSMSVDQTEVLRQLIEGLVKEGQP